MGNLYNSEMARHHSVRHGLLCLLHLFGYTTQIFFFLTSRKFLYSVCVLRNTESSLLNLACTFFFRGRKTTHSNFKDIKFRFFNFIHSNFPIRCNKDWNERQLKKVRNLHSVMVLHSVVLFSLYKWRSLVRGNRYRRTCKEKYMKKMQKSTVDSCTFKFSLICSVKK